MCLGAVLESADSRCLLCRPWTNALFAPLSYPNSSMLRALRATLFALGLEMETCAQDWPKHAKGGRFVASGLFFSFSEH